MEIKYTTDNKKVAVVGNLNSTDKIVREIFVVDGKEIPLGEQFVVKVLHDLPVISWKEKRLREINDLYEKTYTQKEKEYKELQKKYNFDIQAITERLSFLNNFKSSFTEKKLDQLINFISGNVKYIVIERGGTLEISDYDSSIIDKDFGKFDSLKLLSVFGKTNGDISYKMNDYYDGSGHWVTVHPFSTIEQALEFLKCRFLILLENGLTDGLMKVSEKYNIEIPKDKLEEYKEKKRTSITRDIAENKRMIDSLNKELLKYS